jgi:AcrR family transcriptional regulator
VEFDLPSSPEVRDRRVKRSRSALLSAAVRLVGERGTAAVSATDLAEAADVSRRVLYQHFGDRDGVLIAAAVDLVTRELLPQLPRQPDDTAATLAMARHFAEHRLFYRAMLTGSCAYSVTRTLISLFRPYSITSARQRFEDLDEHAAGELADYFTGGTATALSEWLVDGPDRLDPNEFTERLLRIHFLLTGAHHGPSHPHTEASR